MREVRLLVALPGAPEISEASYEATTLEESLMRHMKMRTMVAAGILGMASLLGVVNATASEAATVPNNYYCSRWTGNCVQINGAHVNGLPNACHWVWTYYSSGMSTNGCSYWW